MEESIEIYMIEGNKKMKQRWTQNRKKKIIEGKSGKDGM
jgi:hypothetical protein